MALCTVFLVASFGEGPKKKLGKGGFWNKDNSYSFKTAKEMTPENSVLVCFSMADVSTKLLYAQINPEKSPMIFPVEDEGGKSFVYFPPVEPGTHFKLLSGQTKKDDRTLMYYNGLQYKHKLDIIVPDKPGIYYAGILSDHVDYTSLDTLKVYNTPAGTVEIVKVKAGRTLVKSIFSNMAIPKSEEELEKYRLKTELSVLKGLLGKYKKTAWESVIRAKMEEISK